MGKKHASQYANFGSLRIKISNSYHSNGMIPELTTD